MKRKGEERQLHQQGRSSQTKKKKASFQIVSSPGVLASAVSSRNQGDGSPKSTTNKNRKPTTNTNPKLKKKTVRETDTNALRSARHTSTHNTNACSKQDLASKDLWRTKCGTGPKLLELYYRGQGPGVAYCRDSAAADSSSGTNATDSLTKSAKIDNYPEENGGKSCGGGGLSRASQRRLKKKKKQQGGSGTENDDQISSKQTAQAKVNNDSKHDDPFNEFLNTIRRPLPLSFRLRTFHPSLTNEMFPRAGLDKDEESEDESHLVREQLLATCQYKGVKPLLNNETLNHKRNSSKSHGIYQSKPINDSSKNNGIITKQTLSGTSFSSLLQKASSSRLIARQEVVSCLPVLALSNFLDGGNYVLDLCASPGSKTLQLLETVLMYRKNNKKRKQLKGRVVANDVNSSRLTALQDAVQRSGIPSKFTSRIVYTNHDASVFPLPNTAAKYSTNTHHDGVLADVPCSGDGTVRKDRLVYKHWKPNIGVALHPLQVQILKRALECVKVGGVVVYSTCSLNPMEDEAVVAEVIRCSRHENTHEEAVMLKTKTLSPAVVELLEWPNGKLKGFVRRPGVRKWKVADTKYDNDTAMEQQPLQNDDGHKHSDEEEDEASLLWHDTYQHAMKAGMINAVPSLWPPPSTTSLSTTTDATTTTPSSDDIDLAQQTTADASHCQTSTNLEIEKQPQILELEVPESYHIELCNRILPQDHDTGGFFVALFRKNCEIRF